MPVELRANGLSFRVKSPPAHTWKAALSPHRGSESARWSDRAQGQLLEAAAKLATSGLGLRVGQLAQLAEASEIEVWLDPKESETPVPWEAILARATLYVRPGRRLVVTRHLRTEKIDRGISSRGALFISSNPGWLGADEEGGYDFTDEREMFHHWLPESPLPSITNPTYENPVQQSPRYLHVSGVDVSQATSLRELRLERSPHRELASLESDGRPAFVFADRTKLVRAIDFDAFSEWLVGQDKARPLLVVLNFYNSAALAAKLVLRGVGASIGFVDRVEDVAAEALFGAFYQHLAGQNSLHAVQSSFSHAWSVLQKQNLHHAVGNGVVFCCTGQDESETVRWDGPSLTEPAVGSSGWEGWASNVRLRMSSVDRASYVMLHNGFSLFHDLTLISRSRERVRGQLSVRIPWNSHDDEFSLSVDFTEPLLDLRDVVQFPLTSDLFRTLREGMRTNLVVRFQETGREPEIRSEPITLVAVNEWFDTDRNRALLPSFVLPSDPAVDALIAEAGEVLRILADCRFASFTGYAPTSWPQLNPVELQARALWTLLALRWDLRYSRPRTDEAQRSQRILFPSAINRSGSVTCLDLALLMAACLERLDLKPTLLVSSGHALVGVWRSITAYENFRSQRRLESGSPRGLPAMEARGFAFPWVLRGDEMAVVRELIAAGDVIPIEMTDATSFAPSGTFGGAIQRPLPDFEMIDVGLAREWRVSPLPLASSARSA